MRNISERSCKVVDFRAATSASALLTVSSFFPSVSLSPALSVNVCCWFLFHLLLFGWNIQSRAIMSTRSQLTKDLNGKFILHSFCFSLIIYLTLPDDNDVDDALCMHLFDDVWMNYDVRRVCFFFFIIVFYVSVAAITVVFVAGAVLPFFVFSAVIFMLR